MQEEWRPVVGYEGLYEVSNLGRVKSLYRNTTILSGKTSSNGNYVTVNLWDGKNFSTKKVHRLVAEAFLVNIDNKRCINHKDCNRINNNVSNLEWATNKENTNHSYLLGRIKRDKITGRFTR